MRPMVCAATSAAAAKDSAANKAAQKKVSLLLVHVGGFAKKALQGIHCAPCNYHLLLSGLLLGLSNLLCTLRRLNLCLRLSLLLLSGVLLRLSNCCCPLRRLRRRLRLGLVVLGGLLPSLSSPDSGRIRSGIGRFFIDSGQESADSGRECPLLSERLIGAS